VTQIQSKVVDVGPEKTIDTETHVVTTHGSEVGMETQNKQLNSDNMDELKNMIASVLAVVHQSMTELKESNKALQIKTEASTRELREDNKKFQRNMEDKFFSFPRDS
jgi:hypothetical protein